MRKSEPQIIDLKPEEAAILSLVADYSRASQFKTQLEEALAKSTRRAQKIGQIMLENSKIKNPTTSYALMAQRFLEAKRTYDKITSGLR